MVIWLQIGFPVRKRRGAPARVTLIRGQIQEALWIRIHSDRKDRMDQRTDMAAISHESLGSTRNLTITPVPMYLIIKVADIEIYDWWNNSRVKDESKVAWQTEKLVNSDPTGRYRVGEL